MRHGALWSTKGDSPSIRFLYTDPTGPKAFWAGPGRAGPMQMHTRTLQPSGWNQQGERRVYSQYEYLGAYKAICLGLLDSRMPFWLQSNLPQSYVLTATWERVFGLLIFYSYTSPIS